MIIVGPPVHLFMPVLLSVLMSVFRIPCGNAVFLASTCLSCQEQSSVEIKKINRLSFILSLDLQFFVLFPIVGRFTSFGTDCG